MEVVVCLPGCSIFILAGKQQGTGAPTRSRAFAVQGLGGVYLYVSSGGVDGVFGYTSAESVVGVGKEEGPIADSARGSLGSSL